MSGVRDPGILLRDSGVTKFAGSRDSGSRDSVGRQHYTHTNEKVDKSKKERCISNRFVTSVNNDMVDFSVLVFGS